MIASSYEDDSDFEDEEMEDVQHQVVERAQGMRLDNMEAVAPAELEGVAIKPVGEIAQTYYLYVPPIQRPFEWFDSMVAEFFDMIHRGFRAKQTIPLGNINFWKVFKLPVKR
jgi:hypothetical protein